MWALQDPACRAIQCYTTRPVTSVTVILVDSGVGAGAGREPVSAQELAPAPGSSSFWE